MQRKLVLLLGIVAAVAALAIACSDSDDGNDDGANADADATAIDRAAAENIGVLAALTTLADANLHHVDTTLVGDAPEIDPTWIAPIANARTAVALVAWPDELHEAAENFLNDSMPLLTALQEDDVDAAAAVVSQAHASWHVLRDPGYAYLAEQAGTGAMTDAHEDGDAHEEGDDHEDGDTHEDGDDS